MTSPPRRIAVLTGTRADYGLLRSLLRALAADDRCELLLIVSGTHLSTAHGGTVDEIRADGIPIAAEVPIWSGSDGPVAVASDTGGAVRDYAAALATLEPDVVVVLGDRLEAFAMATAATIMTVPIVHIHGGELTEGAMDDALRHAITKLSMLHFVTADEHAARVIGMGEEPDRVFTLGAPVLDAIESLELLDRAELETRFGIRFGARTVLLTFHPAAYDGIPALRLLRALLAALERLQDTRLIITGTNSDLGSDEIREELREFVERHSATTDYVESFGQLGYLSVMKQVDLVVGNSSSTVLEAPLVGVPSVLIGDRQQGRPLSPSVLHPVATTAGILEAVETALSARFRAGRGSQPTVFGTAGFAARAAEILLTHDFPHPPRKRFWEPERS